MGTKKTILVVDDMPASRRLLATYLRDDFRVVQAADGSECLEKVVDEKPDIVLLDLSLPGMDGIEVIRRIKADISITSIPIVALTAHSQPEYRESATSAGCSAFLVKPFSLDDLRQCVDRLLAESASVVQGRKED